MIPEEAFEKVWNESGAEARLRLSAKILEIEDITGFVFATKAGHKKTWLRACKYMKNGSRL